MSPGNRRRFRSGKPWLLLVPLALVVAVVGFVAWASTPQGEPMPEARAALESDDSVVVETGRWLVFRPAGGEPETGFAFYPGARVPAEAYAPMARALAEEGYLVVLMPVTLNLAILDTGEAENVIQTFPEVEHWAVSGHSLGGVAAASFAHDNPSMVEGAVLMASYPQSSNDLSGRADLAVASIYGTQDGLASPEDVESSIVLLPEDAEFVAIQGGNHGYFGWYGPQPGDSEATITRQEQQEQTVAAATRTLEKISPSLANVARPGLRSVAARRIGGAVPVRSERGRPHCSNLGGIAREAGL